MPGKTAIFGGAFNPVHYGHLRAAEEARQCLGLQKVIFVPAGTPPFREKEQSLAPAADRLEMTRLAVSGGPGFEVSDIECRKPGPSYTVDTLRELRSARPGEDLCFFILGLDAFLELHLWREPEKILEMVSFIVVPRPGHSFLEIMQSPFIAAVGDPSRELQRLDRRETCSARLGLKNGGTLVLLRMPYMEISSSRIRALIRKGSGARYLLPENVLSYIMTKGLYR